MRNWGREIETYEELGKMREKYAELGKKMRRMRN